MDNFKINSKFMTLNGKRIGVYINAGPWVPGVRADMIKIWPRKGYRFSDDVAKAFKIENNSDIQTDYFEKDQIKLYTGHPLYERVKAAANSL